MVVVIRAHAALSAGCQQNVASVNGKEITAEERGKVGGAMGVSTYRHTVLDSPSVHHVCVCVCVCLSVQAHNFFQPLERALHPPQATEDDEPVLAPTGRRRSRAPREGSKKRTKSSRRLTRATASSRSMGKGSNRDRDASRDRRDASADPDGAGAGGGAATDPHIAELARQVKSLRPTTSVLRMVARDIVAPVVTDAMITANQIAVRCGAAPSQ